MRIVCSGFRNLRKGRPSWKAKSLLLLKLTIFMNRTHTRRVVEVVSASEVTGATLSVSLV